MLDEWCYVTSTALDTKSSHVLRRMLLWLLGVMGYTLGRIAVAVLSVRLDKRVGDYNSSFSNRIRLYMNYKLAL